METLADKGNGNYAYLDSLQEAQKVFKDELTGTLVTIAMTAFAARFEQSLSLEAAWTAPALETKLLERAPLTLRFAQGWV